METGVVQPKLKLLQKNFLYYQREDQTIKNVILTRLEG